MEAAAARRHRRADRRGGGVLPAPRRRHHAPRPRPLDAGGRIRHQRSDRDLPDAVAGGGRDHARRSPTGGTGGALARRIRAADRRRRVVGFAGGIAIIQIVNRTNFEPALYPIVVIGGGAGHLRRRRHGLGQRLPRRLCRGARLRQRAHAPRAGAPPLPGGDDLAVPDRDVPDPRPAGDAVTNSRRGAARDRARRVPDAGRAAGGGLALPGRFRFTREEMAFVSWVGLRGAVSILLAILPVIAGLPDGRAMFNVAFIVVLVSLLVQGWTIGPVARFLELVVPPRRRAGRPHRTGAARRRRPRDRRLRRPPGKRGRRPASACRAGRGPSLIIRDGRTLRPHRFGRPQAGDQVYVITTPEYIGLLDRLFAGRARRGRGPGALRRVRAASPRPGWPTSRAPIRSRWRRRGRGADGRRVAAPRARRRHRGGRPRAARRGRHRRAAASTTPTRSRKSASPWSTTAPTRPRIPLFQTPREIAAMVRRGASGGRRSGGSARGGRPRGAPAEARERLSGWGMTPARSRGGKPAGVNEDDSTTGSGQSREQEQARWRARRSRDPRAEEGVAKVTRNGEGRAAGATRPGEVDRDDQGTRWRYGGRFSTGASATGVCGELCARGAEANAVVEAIRQRVGRAALTAASRVRGAEHGGDGDRGRGFRIGTKRPRRATKEGRLGGGVQCE